MTSAFTYYTENNKTLLMFFCCVMKRLKTEEAKEGFTAQHYFYHIQYLLNCKKGDKKKVPPRFAVHHICSFTVDVYLSFFFFFFFSDFTIFQKKKTTKKNFLKKIKKKT